MINLRDFLFCDVILIDTDDKKWKGRIFHSTTRMIIAKTKIP